MSTSVAMSRNETRKRIAVIGVGKVGLPFASYFAERHHVCVYDVNRQTMSAIAEGRNPLPHEPGIDVSRLLSAANLPILLDWDPDVVFIVTPTPQVGNMLSSGPVTAVLSALEALRVGKDRPKLPVAVVSTLDPRDAAQVCSGYQTLAVVYNPPLIRLGGVIADIRSATICFIGAEGLTFDGASDGAGAAVKQVLACYEDRRNARNVIGDVTSVAAAKLAINATLSARAAWGNELGRKASEIGADVRVVFEAINAEPRVGGASYMRPGPPPGGPCLPRDLDVWASLGSDNGLAGATQAAHADDYESLVEQALSFVKSELRNGGAVAILGLSYKPGGLDITGSVGVAVALAIASRSYRVIGCDPVVVPLVERMKLGRPFEANIELVTDPAVAVAVADVVIVCLDTHENRAAVDAGSAHKTVPVLNLDFRR